jgi:hypothetical protein
MHALVVLQTVWYWLTPSAQQVPHGEVTRGGPVVQGPSMVPPGLEGSQRPLPILGLVAHRTGPVPPRTSGIQKHLEGRSNS